MKNRPIKFRSTDEEMFWDWCVEAEKLGIIHNFEYEPYSILIIPKQTTKRIKKLKTKTKEIDKFLLAELSYTPDFVIKSKFNLERLGLIYDSIDDNSEHKYEYIIDVKGMYSQNNDDVQFSVRRKALYYIKQIFVNKLIVDKWFLKTFLPLRTKVKGDLIYTDKGPVRSRFKKAKPYSESSTYYSK